MEKVIVLILAAVITLTAGCVQKRTVEERTVQANSPVSSGINIKTTQGIAYNKIKFETVNTEALSGEISDKIENLKKDKGFTYTEDKDSGYIYIIIFMGEKNTGGYSIEVVSIGDSEGKTEVSVKENAPSSGTMTTQQITYPFTVIKAKGITTNITVTNGDNISYKKLDI